MELLRIVFICGSLEKGRDGVGDYTRRLARELIKSNLEVGLMSLHDRHIQNVLEEELEIEGVFFKTLRLGSTVPWKVREKSAEKFVNTFDPQWLSLQFGPFSFQEKGLPWRLLFFLKELGRKRQWHIMFHELWVGMEREAELKNRIWGKGQEIIIRLILILLAPKLINTQTELYKLHLEKMGHTVMLLPLFGNINVSAKRMDSLDSTVKIAIFGGIHYGAKLEEFITWLHQNNIRKFQFHFIGSNGKEQDTWITILQQKRIDFVVHGWLTDLEVSNALALCNFALTTTPFHLVEKSGSVAAMLEHNLKVLCIARNWEPRILNFPGNGREIPVTQWNEFLTFKDFYSNGHFTPLGLTGVKDQFLEQLI